MECIMRWGGRQRIIAQTFFNGVNGLMNILYQYYLTLNAYKEMSLYTIENGFYENMNENIL